jgi:hypothetical protein
VGDIRKVLDVLGRVKTLKNNDMFAVVAAPEIEDAFVQVYQTSRIALN